VFFLIFPVVSDIKGLLGNVDMIDMEPKKIGRIKAWLVFRFGKEQLVTSDTRGWQIYIRRYRFLGNFYWVEPWRYSDTDEPFDSVRDRRPCKRCGRGPTPEGDDACLGHIEGVKAACCGHGYQDGYIAYLDGRTVPYNGGVL
jgi:hypothetical protein